MSHVVPLVFSLAVSLGVSISARPQIFFRPLDATRPITYFIADGGAATGYRQGDRQLASWALEEWRRSTGDAIAFEAGAEARALVRVYWAEARDGQYGEMRSLTVEGRAGAAIFVRPDVSGLGPEIAGRAGRDPLLRDVIVYLTCVHELGHALGLAHTSDFRDIMYFFGYGGDVGEYFGRYRARLKSRNDLAKTSPLSSGDVEQVRALYVQAPR